MDSASNREITVSPATDLKLHVFFPFFGGADDRVALRLVFQLAHSPSVTASIVYVKTPSVAEDTNNSEASSFATSRDTAFLHSLCDSLPASLSNRVSFLENFTVLNLGLWFEKKEVPSRLKSET